MDFSERAGQTVSVGHRAWPDECTGLLTHDWSLLPLDTSILPCFFLHKPPLIFLQNTPVSLIPKCFFSSGLTPVLCHPHLQQQWSLLLPHCPLLCWYQCLHSSIWMCEVCRETSAGCVTNVIWATACHTNSKVFQCWEVP